MFQGFLLLNSILLAYSSSSPQLIFSTIIYRHGDRTPVRLYPSDPNINNTFFKQVGLGQLTKIGKEQHYMLGKWIRNRYAGLLIGEYHPESIYIRSTDFDRTIMSAESNLAGLFPPSSNDIWSDTIKDWQPIPIHVVSADDDNVLGGSKKCRRYELEYNKLLNSELFKNYDKMNAGLYKMISEKSGSNVSTIVGLNDFYNTLFIENLYNLTIPEWTKPIFPQPLEYWSSLSFQMPCYNKQLQRFKIGLLLNEILTRMELKLLGEITQKVWVYSAHDTTVANVLNTLNLFNNRPPPYTSTLIFELYDTGVKLLFKNDSYSDEVQVLQLPECSEICPIDVFKAVLSSVLISPEQWEVECQVNLLTEMSVKFFKTDETWIVGLLACLLVVTIAILVFVVSITRNSNRLYLRLANDVY